MGALGAQSSYHGLDSEGSCRRGEVGRNPKDHKNELREEVSSWQRISLPKALRLRICYFGGMREFL